MASLTAESGSLPTSPVAPRKTDASARPHSNWRTRWLRRMLLVGSVAMGFVFAGQIGGWLKSLVPAPSPQGHVEYWVSPHDPSFRSDHPGKDAMGMDLIPVHAGEQPPSGPTTIASNLQEENIATTRVERGPLVRTVNTVSTVAYAEPLIADVTLKVDAWLEKLSVKYEGQPVIKGDPLFEVYSPQLVSAQEQVVINQRAVEDAKRLGAELQKDATANLAASIEKLRYWDVDEAAIAKLEKTRAVQKTLTFSSRVSGIVIQKKAFEGKYLPAGQLLYRVADLSKVWVYAYVYPNQTHCVYGGQPATLTVPDLPGRQFRGKVLFIYPYLEPKIRAVKVRLEFENPDLLLKPDMFTHIEFTPHKMGIGLSIPRSALVNTGLRHLAYVVLPDGSLEARELRLGRDLDNDRVEILSGLQEGESIVASPSFLMDSESRLRLVNRKFRPLPSMMSHSMHKTAMPTPATPGGHPAMHHHGPMDAKGPTQASQP